MDTRTLKVKSRKWKVVSGKWRVTMEGRLSGDTFHFSLFTFDFLLSPFSEVCEAPTGAFFVSGEVCYER
jgi:hypothetical protein